MRGGSRVATLWQEVLPGYLRFVPVLLGTITGAVLIIGGSPAHQQLIRPPR